MKNSNFKLSEFRCKCGKCKGHTPTHIYLINSVVIPRLEIIRSGLANHPIYINSGIRCITHNKNVGGAGNSMHLDGLAVDIRSKHYTPSYIYRYLDSVRSGLEITELIKYPNFVHVGFRKNTMPRERIY